MHARPDHGKASTLGNCCASVKVMTWSSTTATVFRFCASVPVQHRTKAEKNKWRLIAASGSIRFNAPSRLREAHDQLTHQVTREDDRIIPTIDHRINRSIAIAFHFNPCDVPSVPRPDHERIRGRDALIPCTARSGVVPAWTTRVVLQLETHSNVLTSIVDELEVDPGLRGATSRDAKKHAQHAEQAFLGSTQRSQSDTQNSTGGGGFILVGMGERMYSHQTRHS